MSAGSTGVSAVFECRTVTWPHCFFAKAISTGSRNITLADLASPELVTDEAFHLIVCALLLAKYGDAILNFEGK